MATEELPQPQPSSLPPYPQMIMEAMDALKEGEGASKASISKFMESKHGEMSGGHSDQLSMHLGAMKDSGELLLMKNNYMKPSSDVPPKRGRGRPPKAKVDPMPMPEAGVVAPAPPRPRGRPKKDPNLAPAPKKAKTADAVPPSTGRPRGRPRKVQPLQNGVEA